jgi:hypothetical protein
LVVLVAAASVATGFAARRAHAAESGEPTTARQCYKSVRACQKQRCSKIEDQDQVSCMRQCNREYETCVSGAGAGTSGGIGSVLGSPEKLLTPNKPKDIRRKKQQGDQD